MTTPDYVEQFYKLIWNAGDVDAAQQLLASNFSFRGSLGAELKGREAFVSYVKMVRTALADYRCEILECVTEGDRAFAQLRFSGRHAGTFLGYPPTAKSIDWMGAALFQVKKGVVSKVWVLGDLAGLESVLRRNQSTLSHSTQLPGTAR